MTTTSHPDDRLIIMRISWTDRPSRTRRVSRIISARIATKRERKFYAKELGHN
jgi:uncharacterized DUF497 family protein